MAASSRITGIKMQSQIMASNVKLGEAMKSTTSVSTYLPLSTLNHVYSNLRFQLFDCADNVHYKQAERSDQNGSDHERVREAEYADGHDRRDEYVSFRNL